MVAFEVPDRMEVGVASALRARISRHDTEALTEGLRRGGYFGREPLKVGGVMQMRLKGAPEDTFQIESLHEKDEGRQVIPAEGYAEWKWRVTPLYGGTGELTMRAGVKLELGGGMSEETMYYTVWEKTFAIKANLWNWIGLRAGELWRDYKAGVIALIASLLAGLGWLIKRAMGSTERSEAD